MDKILENIDFAIGGKYLITRGKQWSQATKSDVEDIWETHPAGMIGGLLIFHGISKIIHGVDFIQKSLVAAHLPAFIAYGVYVGEVVAPLFILAGRSTRLGALVVAIDLVVAILLVRLPSLLTIDRGGGWGMELDAFFPPGALVICLDRPAGSSSMK